MGHFRRGNRLSVGLKMEFTEWAPASRGMKERRQAGWVVAQAGLTQAWE